MTHFESYPDKPACQDQDYFNGQVNGEKPTVTPITTTTKEVYTTAQIFSLLKARHADNRAWAFFPEFRESTGVGVRALDALAISLYASTGIMIHGFEIKSSREDLIRELNDPAKSDSVGKFTDFFWLVVANKKMTDGLQIPEPWGILAPRGDRLGIVRKAQKLPCGIPLAVRPFLASLARRTAELDAVPAEEAKKKAGEARNEGYVEGRRTGEQISMRERDSLREELRAERGRVQIFEDAAGIRIGGDWESGNVGRAVRKVLAGENAQVEIEALKLRLLSDLERTKKTIVEMGGGL